MTHSSVPQSIFRSLPKTAPLKYSKILLVEDTEDQAFLTKEYLFRAGFPTKRVADAESAIRTLTQENFEILILDLVMPVRSGLDVLDFLKSLPRANRPKVLITTATTGWSESLANKGYQTDSFLEKPFSFRELVQQVSFLLKSQTMTHSVMDRFIMPKRGSYL